VSKRSRRREEEEPEPDSLPPPPDKLKPVGRWTDQHGEHMKMFAMEVKNTYQRYLTEYDISYLELLGVLGMIRTELEHDMLHEDM
jgi:hypothetical protein